LPCGAVQQHTKGAAEQAIIGNVLPELASDAHSHAEKLPLGVKAPEPPASHGRPDNFLH